MTFCGVPPPKFMQLRAVAPQLALRAGRECNRPPWGPSTKASEPPASTGRASSVRTGNWIGRSDSASRRGALPTTVFRQGLWTQKGGGAPETGSGGQMRPPCLWSVPKLSNPGRFVSSGREQMTETLTDFGRSGCPWSPSVSPRKFMVCLLMLQKSTVRSLGPICHTGGGKRAAFPGERVTRSAGRHGRPWRNYRTRPPSAHQDHPPCQQD